MKKTVELGSVYPLTIQYKAPIFEGILVSISNTHPAFSGPSSIRFCIFKKLLSFLEGADA